MSSQQQGGGGPNPGGGANVAPNAAVVAPNAAVVIPPVNGGVTATGQAWTGGSRDPVERALITNPRSPLCIRSDSLNYRVWARCEKGVEEGWMIKLNNTLPLTTCEPIIHDGLKDVSADSVFWMHINGQWGDLFLHPDTASIAAIRAHENILRAACPYDRENLLYSRKFLENSVDQALRRRIAPSLLPSDGGPVFWSLIKVALHGAETSKLIRHQNVITKTKLVNFPGYDVAKYHEVLLPSLHACNEANHLPLNVGPTVIANHTGPSNMGYSSVLQSYAGEQAGLHDSQSQYKKLIVQMDSLREIALNDLDWEKVEGQKGAYTSQLRQKDLSHVTCYGCGEKGHIKKQCPHKKKKSGESGKGSNNSGQPKKKWYNENLDNKSVMEKEGKTYHWCKNCAFGRGKWTEHKTDDCPHKNKKTKTKKSDGDDSNGGNESGFLVMDLIESGFLSVELL